MGENLKNRGSKQVSHNYSGMLCEACLEPFFLIFSQSSFTIWLDVVDDVIDSGVCCGA